MRNQLQLASVQEIEALEACSSIDIMQPVIVLHQTVASTIYLTNDKLFIEYIKSTNSSLLYTSLEKVIERIRTFGSGSFGAVDINNLIQLKLPSGAYEHDKVILDLLKNYMAYGTRYLSKNKKSTRVKLYHIGNADEVVNSLRVLFPHAVVDSVRQAGSNIMSAYIHFPYCIL